MAEYWWDKTVQGEEVRRRVMASWTHVDSMQADLRARANANWGLYLGRSGVDLGSTSWTLQGRTYSQTKDGRRENIIRSAIGALTAKISANRPLPRVLTDGGDFKLQKQAKLAQLWIEGVLDETGCYPLSRQVFLDGCLATLGLVKVFPDAKAGKVRVERVLRSDIAVDPHDARNGAPRTLFQCMIVSREVLTAAYGEKLVAVEGAALTGRTTSDTDPASVIDPVVVVEAWHLPSGPDSVDGRHVICTQAGKPLLDEPWKRDRFPFASWRWSTQPLGWDGVPAVDELLPYQEMHDYLSSRIDVMIEQCKSHVGFEQGSKVNTDAYDSANRENGFFTYTGKEPVVLNDPGPPVALLMERERIKAAAFEQIGISQLTAQSQLPRGVESRVAMQEYKDTESERFLDVGQAWEEFFCGSGGLADLLMDAAEDMETDIIVRPSDGKVTKEVRWSEISAVRKDMRVSVRPASFLPTSPAERIARIEALSQVAELPPATLARMIDHPDVDAAIGQMTAAEDAIRFDIEQMEENIPTEPEPFVDVEMALSMVLAHRNKLRGMGAPPELLDTFTHYLLRLSEMKASMVRGAGQVAGAGAPEAVATAALATPGIEGTVAPMPGMGGPMGEMPQGMPMPAPQGPGDMPMM